MHTAKRNPTSRHLAAALSAAFGLLGMHAHASAGVLPVTSCADDNGAGTLRQVAAVAVHGDTIDLSGLSCVNSTITLTQGEVVLPVNVTLNGPADGALTLTSVGSRILKSISADAPAYLNVANLTLSGGRVYSNGDSADGGCVFATGAVNLTNATVTDCAVHASLATARGGAIYAQSVALNTSRVTHSSADATGSYQLVRGGGIYAASLSCVDGTIDANFASADVETSKGEGGGAMVVGGDVLLNRCTISNNAAGDAGGIMHLSRYNSSTSIENSTISGNTGRHATGGISVFCSKCTPALLQVLNSTIAMNTAPGAYGAGLSANSNVDAQSSIIAGNSSLSGGFGDLYAPSMSGADNLVQSTNVTPPAGVITISADPQLLPLANNGGVTFTHALAAGSPALGHGNNVTLLSTDQRGAGFSRSLLNGSVDIGAWQTQDAGAQAAPADNIFGARFD